MSDDAHLSKTPPATGPPWVAQGVSRGTIDRHWLVVALAMLASGVCFFGWRAAVSVGVTAAVVVMCHLVIAPIVRWWTRKPAREGWVGATTVGLLMGLVLPMTNDLSLPVIAGAIAGLLMQVIGRTHRLRLHPVPATLLILWLAPAMMWGTRISTGPWRFNTVDAVLSPERMVIGDVYRQRDHRESDPWWTLRGDDQSDAVKRSVPGAVMLRDRWLLLDHPTLLVNSLSSGTIARMEEVVLGCIPGPIGATSRALILSLGLYLMYRQLSWWPMVVASLLSAIAALLLMPPGPRDWSTTVLSKLSQLPEPVSATYVAYMLLASPLPLAVMILAPLSAPMSLRGRLLYGAFIGAGGVALMWFTGVPQTALFALVPMGLLARPLDALQRSPWALGRPIASTSTTPLTPPAPPSAPAPPPPPVPPQSQGVS